MVNQINHRYLHFGPVIGGTKVDPTICKELLERGHKTTKSHVKYLAGHLDKENVFESDDKQWFVDNFQDYFIPYWKHLQNVMDPNYFYGMDPFKKLWLSNLWINFMKKGEFNPPHGHDGDFSFVLYLDVPKELAEEDRNFIGNGTGPGSISFIYGEEQKNIRTAHGVIPSSNELWIFPASLKHLVPPFKSDVERISVSGNWFIIDHSKSENKELEIGKVLIK
jgi:hypothetical protein